MQTLPTPGRATTSGREGGSAHMGRMPARVTCVRDAYMGQTLPTLPEHPDETSRRTVRAPVDQCTVMALTLACAPRCGRAGATGSPHPHPPSGSFLASAK